MSVWKRRLAMGSNSLFATLFFLTALGFTYAIVSDHRVVFDLSEDDANTLMPDTIAKMELLKNDAEIVTITAFTSQAGKPFSTLKNRKVKDLLARLKRHCDIINYRIVDFDRERLTAENLGVREYGSLVIQRGDARIDIKERNLFQRKGKGVDMSFLFLGEEKLSSAFSQLRNDKPKIIYFLSQHGEHSTSDSSSDGLSLFASKMLLDRFEAKPLNLLSTRNGQAPVVPSDATAIAIMGPKVSLADNETDALLTYLSQGGSLFLTVDVDGPDLPLLNRLGVKQRDGVAVDRSTHALYWDRPIPLMKPHDITNDLIDNQLSVVLAHPSPLSYESAKGRVYSNLLTLSRNGWIDRGGTLNGSAAVFDAGIDVQEAAPLMVAIKMNIDGDKPFQNASRIVVSGDVDWLQNDMFTGGNVLLATNIMRWLSEEDELLNTQVNRTDTVRRLIVPKPELSHLRNMALFPVPILTLLIGFFVWLNRRGR